ncbi:flagellar basal-body MS-ring/collar protein FliF [Jannaschia sp. KMU-145]|uniref:flagellar basal-body MS-ring/collar protein FliF n=1 Tax=Jannaschia halovivens TaxID=3388667 RepID=UPI00396B24E6
MTALWGRQDKRRLVILAGATVLTFAMVFGLTRLATAPGMELLYAGLEPAAASEVIAGLEARGAAYEVRGSSIFVEDRMRDGLRMQLAGDGLPRMDGSGYELLDGLTGFGTTSQMFDAAYWRAREGELTRTILASPGVRSARVHLATADSSPFARDRSATASVTLQMVSGTVDASLAHAVQSLVSGAVRNLAAEDVTVIDAASGRVLGGGAIDPEAERRETRAIEMRAAVENLLAARVGPDRFVVELAIETTQDRELITERVLDPESRVVVSTDTEERSASDRAAAGAGVTVASNLPDGDAAQEGGQSESSNAETRERVNYDFSATERQIERAPGAIERVTVAVMVDGLRAANADGAAEWSERSEAELEVIRDLVQSAVGFRADRGDVVTVRSMEFDIAAVPEAPLGLSLPWLSGGDVRRISIAALLALVTLGLLAFVVRPLMTRALAPPPANPALPAAVPDDGATAIAPEEIGRPSPASLAPPEPPDAPTPTEGTLLPADTESGDADDPVDRLRTLITERRDETLEVLRGWMDESPEEAK